MIAFLWAILATVVQSACARNDATQFSLDIETESGVPEPDSIIIFLRRNEGGTLFSSGVNLVPFSSIADGDGDNRARITIPFEDDFQGRVSVYVVACSGIAQCQCLEASCSDEQKTLGPDCSCTGDVSIGITSIELAGAMTSVIALRGMPSYCDRDGDLFPACLDEAASNGCCAGLSPPDKATIHDCHDLPRPDGCESSCETCGIRGCDTRFAHPFRPQEPTMEMAQSDNLSFRHRAWCEDGLINDCRGPADVECGDLDGDGYPFGPLDCDDDDPEVSSGAAEICGDGIDQDCRGGDSPCDEDMDGVLASQDCDDANSERFPGNPEICGDGIDQNCDGEDEVCLPLSDLDGDGALCETPFPWSEHRCFEPGSDCNDLDSRVFPGAPEVCGDQVDQDCDGVDPSCSEGDGDGDGFVSGDDGGTDCDDNNPDIHPMSPERCGDDVDQDCDGFDQVCDGIVDEDADGYAPPDDCNDRIANVYPTAIEVCNRIDDDCDGFVDEGNPLTDSLGRGNSEVCGSACPVEPCACRVAPQVCTRNVQTGAALIQCLGVSASERVEQCSGVDEDCDGRFNEGVSLACYTGQPAETVGVGVCVGGVGQCRMGVELTGIDECTGEVVPGAEQCNGLDDDCDGVVDENADRPCGQDEGECTSGRLECVEGRYHQLCIGERRPEAEVCDNLDNDCDGAIDQINGQPLTRDCYEGERTTLGRGICRGGVQECVRGRWSACRGQVLPAALEECNGLDDDCNGVPDDGIDAVATQCGVGLCAARGERICRAGQFRDICEIGNAQPEICDELDNDCDGRIDENIIGGATVCGSGACEATGQLVCNRGRLIDSCQAGDGTPEICDGQDNDCDGNVDNGLEVIATECGLGVCAARGISECVQGVFVDSCQPNMNASIAEVCDGLDNDCDGRVDEDADGESVCSELPVGGMMPSSIGGGDASNDTPVDEPLASGGSSDSSSSETDVQGGTQ